MRLGWPAIRVRGMLLLVALAACGLASFIAWPRSMPLLPDEDRYTGYFTGLGLVDDASPLGRRFYRVHIDDGPCGFMDVDVRGDGQAPFREGLSHGAYYPYRGHYPDGTLREEGECRVKFLGLPIQPSPDNHDIRNGRFYKPDGSLGSVVRDGSGVQIYWYPDGRIRWRLELKNYNRVLSQMWDREGKLRHDQTY